MASIGKIIELIIVHIIGIFWSFWVVCSTVLRYLKDPSQKWGVTVRKERPLCLKSTEKWTHHLVTLQHDGIKLHYVSAGATNKPLMVLLHGFPETWFSWRSQLEYFKDNYRVVALSMRGYADSDAPSAVDRYKIHLLVEDVKGLVRSLGAEDCVLVGHDWGGGVAWAVATAAPEVVSKLIILNCPNGAAFRKVLRSSMKQFLMSWYMMFFQLPYLPEYLLTRGDLAMFKQLWRSLGLDHEEENTYLYYYSQPGALTGPINYYRSAFRHREAEEFTSPPTITLPVLIIWGTDDLALSEQLATLSAEYCSNVRIRKIKDGNHFIQQHKPDEVNAFMEEFLKEK